MAGKRVNNWQTTAPELEKTQHQVVDESAKNDIKSVVYTGMKIDFARRSD